MTLGVAILAGQAVASVLVDGHGRLGFVEHPVKPGRLLGVALLADGVVLVRLT